MVPTSPPMLTTPRFPLLKLPALSIVKVLEGIEVFQLIPLSLASKKIENILESFTLRNASENDNKLHVDCDNCYERRIMTFHCGENFTLKIRLRTNNDGLLESCEDSELPKIFSNLDGITVPMKINQEKFTITSYWENHITGVKAFLQYFCRIFNPTITIRFFQKDEAFVFGVLDVLKKEKAKLDKVSFLGDNPSHRLYQNLLELPCRILNLFSSPDSKFQYKPSDEPMKFIELNISQARWNIDLEHFLHCKSIYLRNTQLTEQDLNKFLKKWIESGSSLEYANVSTDSWYRPRLRTIVEGLLAIPVISIQRRAGIIPYTQDFAAGKCFSLEKSNGENAIIFQLKDSSVILETPSNQRSPFFNMVRNVFYL